MPNDFIRYFIAATGIALYTELLTRIAKKPAICFLIIGIIPLVPGGGIYYTMYYFIEGNSALFVKTGQHTLSVASALAAGITLVVSLMRLFRQIRRKTVRSEKKRAISEK